MGPALGLRYGQAALRAEVAFEAEQQIAAVTARLFHLDEQGLAAAPAPGQACRQLLLGVVNEYGVMTGVVALEDVMESLIGREIVDETDTDVDMQAVARRRITDHYDELKPDDDTPRDPEPPLAEDP